MKKAVRPVVAVVASLLLVGNAAVVSANTFHVSYTPGVYCKPIDFSPEYLRAGAGCNSGVANCASDVGVVFNQWESGKFVSCPVQMPFIMSSADPRTVAGNTYPYQAVGSGVNFKTSRIKINAVDNNAVSGEQFVCSIFKRTGWASSATVAAYGGTATAHTAAFNSGNSSCNDVGDQCAFSDNDGSTGYSSTSTGAFQFFFLNPFGTSAITSPDALVVICKVPARSATTGASSITSIELISECVSGC